LKVVLRYRDPPARVLELGAGHGAYTALLRWAGYDATALDLSPWVAEFASERFRIPYLIGRIEDQNIEPRSLDIIVANDLMEHLPNPMETLRTCAELLAEDGLIVIQTPEWVPERLYQDLVADDDPFLEHMRRAQKEHLYLYSRRALISLLAQSGLGETSFEEPPYPYDMVCVASARPLSKPTLDFEAQLVASPNGLLVLALIDAHDAWLQSERDRADRLRVLETLDSSLRESEADRAARLEAVKGLETTLKEVETDRAARLEAVKRLESALAESEADRTARLELIARLEKTLEEVETDRAARLEAVKGLETTLKEVETDRAARLDVIDRLQVALAESEADREARLEAIARVSRGEAVGPIDPEAS